MAETNITVGHQTKSDHNCLMSAQTVCWADKMTGENQPLARISIEQCSMAHYTIVK